MSYGHAGNSLSIFGQHPQDAPARSAAPLPEEPQLAVPWGSFRQSAASSVRAIVARPWAQKNPSQAFFCDRWMPRRFGGEALAAAVLLHVIFMLLPWSRLQATPHKNPALENFQLTWSGPINDLPPLNLPGAKAPLPSPRGDAQKPLATEGADAFHPRQRIFTDPAAITHPRQTLINTAAPATPPKILAALPNIVELQPAAVPARPKIEITEQTLAQLHPREHRAATVRATPAPDVANADGAPSPINLAPSPNAPARPQLELNTGAAPRVAQHRVQSADAPAPEIARQNPSNASASTLIALSATPGPVAPAAPPQGNLAARIAISPEGKNPGSSGGTPTLAPKTNGGANGSADSRGGAGAGTSATANSTAVSISGGNPSAKMSGLGGNPPLKLDTSAARGLAQKFDPRSRVVDEPERTGPPNFATLAPGAKPELVFNSKKVYTLLVNMPNLNSATGSWVLNFSELHSPNAGPAAGELNGPAPLRKSDPKYPPTLAREHVEGEVVLYAVIRADGSVDSVQLVRGIDEQLDANAMQALTQWKFRPASRQGTPVDLEAIVHIPFHAPGESLIR